jgi:hypothetical protein
MVFPNFRHRVRSLFQPSCRAATTKKHAKFGNRVRLDVEPLERREVLSGFWTQVDGSINNGFLPAIQHEMLLPDGSVLLQNGSDFASNGWFRLTPDSSGSYANGTLTPVPNSSLPRLFYASDVLRDGRVFVLGGEYTSLSTSFNQPPPQTETNTGEIYDPVANTWTPIANYPQSTFGDAPSAVLPDGQVLAGWQGGPENYVYDPVSNSWSQAASKLYGDNSEEEGWVKLADGSILTVDTNGWLPNAAQRYVPQLNQWVASGTTPAPLATDASYGNLQTEIGPGILLPDGRVFWIGATGHTALYTPGTGLTDPGNWTAGPDIPGGLGAVDAPCALEPNGTVLFTAQSINNTYQDPVNVFEYYPGNNQIIPVSLPPNANYINFLSRMLVLPNGQILYCDSENSLYVYTEDPNTAPNPAWAPTISNVTANQDGSFTLTGTQLEGLSEGSSYGDDAQNATNFPIVRLTDAVGNVHYARTYNFNPNGPTTVQTGSTPVSTQFVLPAGIGDGAYLLSAIANGIASSPALYVLTSPSDFNVTLQLDPNNPSAYQVLLNGSLRAEYPVASFSRIIVDLSTTNTVVNVHQTPSGVPLSVDGNGNNIIHVGNSTNGVQGIQGDVYLENPPSFNSLIVDDAADGGNIERLVTLSTYTPAGDSAWGSITGLAPASINYRLADTASNIAIDGGSDGDIFTITGGASFQTINLTDGAGNDTFNVLATSAPLNIDGGGGQDQVNIGNGTVSNINGPVTVSDTGGSASLLVEDYADTIGRTVSMEDGSLSGLAPAPISWTPTATGSGGVTSLHILGGSGSNTFNVYNTSNFGSGSTWLQSGDGNSSSSVNTVNVETTESTLFVDGGSAFQQVLVGSNAPFGNGTLGGINGPVDVYNSNPNGYSVLTLDDRGDATGRVASMYSGVLTGLSPAPIFWTANAPGTYLGGVEYLQIYGGSGSNTWTIHDTGSFYTGTSLSTGNGTAGNNTANVLATTGGLYLNGGSGTQSVVIGSNAPSASGGTLANIKGFVSVGGAGSTSLAVDDSGDTLAHSATLSASSALGILAGLSPGPIYFGAGVSSLAINGGKGASSYDVEGTLAGTATALNAGSGNDTFTVSAAAQDLDFIAGPLSINGGGGTNRLTLNDQSNLPSHGYTLTAGTLVRSGSPTISFSGLTTLTLNGSASGGSVFVISAAPPTTTVTLNGAGAGNALFGPNVNQMWNITGANAGNLGSKLLFTDVQSLVGGSGNDTFRFLPAGSVSGIIVGSGGINKLDYSLGGTTPAFVELSTAEASRVNGNAPNGFFGIQSLIANPAVDNTLVGPDTDTLWTISSPNCGKVGTVLFTNFQTLVGGAGVDVFKFIGTGSAGLIDGSGAPAGRGNWLDYSALTSAVSVNLQTGSASRVGGGTPGLVFDIQNVHGSNGGSTLTGDNQGNILIGGTGNDTLFGGAGASLLIGDKGADQIFGGSGSDILIGDSTIYDPMTTANENALMGILAEWQSGDGQAVKFYDINTGTGGGLNGTAQLNFGKTVKDDGSADTVTAAFEFVGFDWFFQGQKDTVQNFVFGDHLNNT